MANVIHFNESVWRMIFELLDPYSFTSFMCAGKDSYDLAKRCLPLTIKFNNTIILYNIYNKISFHHSLNGYFINGYMINGKREGVWTISSINGDTQYCTYNKGILSGNYRKDGWSGEYLDGKKVGHWNFANGFDFIDVFYEDDKMHGINVNERLTSSHFEINIYRNGNLIKTINTYYYIRSRLYEYQNTILSIIDNDDELNNIRLLFEK